MRKSAITALIIGLLMPFITFVYMYVFTAMWHGTIQVTPLFQDGGTIMIYVILCIVGWTVQFAFMSTLDKLKQ